MTLVKKVTLCWLVTFFSFYLTLDEYSDYIKNLNILPLNSDKYLPEKLQM